jgi:hypothetical protein
MDIPLDDIVKAFRKQREYLDRIISNGGTASYPKEEYKKHRELLNSIIEALIM